MCCNNYIIIRQIGIWRGCPRRQCVTNCVSKIGYPLDQSLSHARRMEFDKLEFGSQICTAPLPLPLGEVPRFANRGGEGFDRIRPSQSKIKDFCQLPQWGSQDCLCQRQLVVKFKFYELIISQALSTFNVTARRLSAGASPRPTINLYGWQIKRPAGCFMLYLR